MGIILIALWLILHGVLELVSTKIPTWIDPLSAIIVGVLVAVVIWRNPKSIV